MNKPNIATIGHSGCTTYAKYSSFQNMQALFGKILKREKMMLSANKKYSAISASSLPSERLLSKAGQMVRSKQISICHRKLVNM